MVRDNALFDFIQGHTAEVLSLCFNTVGNQLVTGSFDHTVAIWDVASGRSDIIIVTAMHTSICVSSFILYSTQECATDSLLLFTVLRCVHTLAGHSGEISNVQFNWDCSLIITASMDKTCKVNCHQPKDLQLCVCFFYLTQIQLVSQKVSLRTGIMFFGTIVI